MILFVQKFLREEDAAITVDWTVLSALVVGMSLASTAIVNGGLDVLASNLESQLREQQISDSFVYFRENQFDTAFDAGLLDAEGALEAFDQANEMTNADIISGITDFISNLTNGVDMSDAEIAEAFAMASVAYQRNIVDDEVIHAYFGDAEGNYGGNPYPGSDIGDYRGGGDDPVNTNM